MLNFLLGLIGYMVVWYAWRAVGRKWPNLLRELEEWALPTVTILLIVGLVMLL